MGQSCKFDEVLDEFRARHLVSGDVPSNTNAIAEANLREANRQLRGEWARIELRMDDLDSIVLPWHASEGGAIQLVPREGATVQRAVHTLLNTVDSFERDCPICWKKMQRFRTSDNLGGPLFLSRAPLTELEDYKHLTARGLLYHLDGLHRMVAWRAFSSKVHKVTAYVAGSR